MQALSIQQPWAWLVAHGYKDIENREWSTGFRGRFLIHAGKRFDADFNWAIFASLGIAVPNSFDCGGIVGAATLTNVVTHSPNRWFVGRYGFLLKDACPLSFEPLRGQLYFFSVPEHMVNLQLGHEEQVSR